MGVNNKDFAAMRGVDPSRVSQWKRQGRLILDADGKINAAATNAALDASLDQVKGARRAGNVTSTSPGPGSAGGNGQTLPLDGRDDRPPDGGERAQGTKESSDYWFHKSKREKAEAQLSQMKALQMAGSLVWGADVERERRETARKVRNAVMATSDQLAQVIVHVKDPATARKIINDHLEKALRELSDGMEKHAAEPAGVEEGEAALL